MTYRLSPEYLPNNLRSDLLTHSQPWSHFILDSLLDSQDFQALQQQLLSQSHPFKILEEDPEQIQFQALPDMKLAATFLNDEFKSLLEKLCGARLSIYKSGALQLRRMTSTSPAFPAHHDFIDHRTLVMLFYLSPHWSKEKGGELCLHQTEESAAEGTDSKWIAPLENRMVLFFGDTTNWHSVREVRNWERYLVFAEWSVVS